MIRKYHNHKLQTTPWHREEEPLNHHETPGRHLVQIDFISRCQFVAKWYIRQYLPSYSLVLLKYIFQHEVEFCV